MGINSKIQSKSNKRYEPILKATSGVLYYFNRLWDCPERGSSNPGPGSGVTVDRESNAISVHPIIAGSTKLPDWLIREAKETLENNIRAPQEKQ